MGDEQHPIFKIEEYKRAIEKRKKEIEEIRAKKKKKELQEKRKEIKESRELNRRTVKHMTYDGLKKGVSRFYFLSEVAIGATVLSLVYSPNTFYENGVYVAEGLEYVSEELNEISDSVRSKTFEYGNSFIENLINSYSSFEDDVKLGVENKLQETFPFLYNGNRREVVKYLKHPYEDMLRDLFLYDIEGVEKNTLDITVLQKPEDINLSVRLDSMQCPINNKFSHNQEPIFFTYK